MFANTSYGRGGVTTAVGGMPAAVDTSNFLQALLRRETRPSPLTPPQTVNPIYQPPPVAASPMRVLGGDGMSALEKQARNAQLRDVVLAQKAKEAGPPRVWRQIGNQALLTTDPEGMNAYQRELYVPGGSSMGSSPGEAAAAQESLLSNLAFEDRFRNGVRAANMGTPGGNMQANWWGLSRG